MTQGALACAVAVAFSVGACAQRGPETSPSQPDAVLPAPAGSAPGGSVPTPRAARTLDEYKRLVAQRIAGSSAETFADPLPEVLKSVVVLDLRIDRNGMPQQVSVRRSNGIRLLEQRALESVRRAAPFDAPPFRLLRGGSVEFLETFLFRDDGRFQIRSLVEAPR